MPEDIENADFGAKERSGYYATTAGVVHVKAFRSRHDWAHLAAQGNSLSIAIDCGVQFLTRSHRTALSEQTGPVPRVITISFSSKMPYTVLVSGSAAPEVAAMMTVLFVMESSAKLQW